VITPLSAELMHVVEVVETENPGVFGESGVYGRAFAVYTFTLGLAIILGPTLSGYLQTHFGWNFMSMILGVLSASGAIPVVCD
jgi:MFS family permease